MTKYVKIDPAKIFLTPPVSMLEKIMLFLSMAGFFMLFFRPLQFTNMSPVDALLTAALPTLSLSWSWIVILRFLFNKRLFSK